MIDPCWCAVPERDLHDDRCMAARGLLDALRFVYDHIADPERDFRDLYPAFGLNAATAVEMVRGAIAKAEAKQ